MSVIHQPRQPEIDLRLFIFPVVGASLFALLFLRLWYIQVVKSEALTERAEASREQKVEKVAPRGLMFDRNGALVAGVRSEIVITAIPSEVRKHPETLDRVAQILNVKREKLQEKVDDAFWRPYIESPIYVGASVAAGVKIAESAEDLPGIGVETQPMRYYPDSVSFTHVLGSVRIPNESDVDRLKEMKIEPARYVGRDGVERAYEEYLMGSPGRERMEADAKGRPTKVLGRDIASAGKEIVLTLDARLQKLAMKRFGEKGYTGGIAAIDPRTGEVLCLVSAPTFDQNLFQGGISSAEWKALQNHPGKPMLNRAIYSSYSPGSTFKIVTTLAVQKAGKFDPQDRIYCGGGYRLGRRFAKCLGHHGPISFYTAMQKSCNTYFFTQGMRAGEENLRKAALEMGLGHKTGIEIIGEGSGIVPNDEWIRRYRKDYPWTGGDTLNMSIGQGELRCTPLQMANVVAMVANGGVNYRPHLVKQIRDPKAGSKINVKPEVAHRSTAPASFWELEQKALVGVIQGGTARVAQLPGVVWGGKTGSTEHRKGKKTHGWFVGFAPAENPKIAIAVIAEAAGHGGAVAAPIAKEIVATYLNVSLSEEKDAASSSANRASSRRPASR